MADAYTLSEFDIKLQKCVSAAMRGHYRQFDKRGKPYIQHLFRVAGLVERENMPVAILHDYFEDVHSTEDPEEMKRTFPLLEDDEIQALWLLTRPKGMTYRQYIERIHAYRSKIAVDVKIADLKDHLASPYDDFDGSLMVRYRKALAFLEHMFGIHEHSDWNRIFLESVGED